MGQERRDGPRKDLRQLETALRQYGDGPRRPPGTIRSTPATLSRIRVLEMFPLTALCGIRRLEAFWQAVTSWGFAICGCWSCLRGPSSLCAVSGGWRRSGRPSRGRSRVRAHTDVLAACLTAARCSRRLPRSVSAEIGFSSHRALP